MILSVKYHTKYVFFLFWPCPSHRQKNVFFKRAKKRVYATRHPGYHRKPGEKLQWQGGRGVGWGQGEIVCEGYWLGRKKLGRWNAHTRSLVQLWCGVGLELVGLSPRKALDNIDLNQMSHWYVSGGLQNDWNDPVDFRSLDRSQRKCYIWVSWNYKTVSTVVSSLYHQKSVKSIIDSAVLHWTTRLMVFPRT